eukprot:scaffold3330_cov164-Amphora_coffeaeformis.AAC.5
MSKVVRTAVPARLWCRGLPMDEMTYKDQTVGLSLTFDLPNERFLARVASQTSQRETKKDDTQSCGVIVILFSSLANRDILLVLFLNQL